ncbi:MAG: translation initiation factor IF-2 subunit beta [Nanoarchaeota archaeon]|nr:translation initiation factor IF-2 subunit beta [Nanoarchaeota archaeon]
MADYKKLLDDAYKEIKPIKSSISRFEIPEIRSSVQGNKTIFSNFLQVASYLRRKPEHLEKFLEKELAAKGKIEGDRLVFIKKITLNSLSEKIKIYVEKYVLCKECKKPDTEIVKQDDFQFIHCLACGAKHSIAKI